MLIQLALNQVHAKIGAKDIKAIKSSAIRSLNASKGLASKSGAGKAWAKIYLGNHDN